MRAPLYRGKGAQVARGFPFNLSGSNSPAANCDQNIRRWGQRRLPSEGGTVDGGRLEDTSYPKFWHRGQYSATWGIMLFWLRKWLS